MFMFLSIVFILGLFFVVGMVYMLSKPERKVWKVAHKDFSVNRNYLVKSHEEDEFITPTKKGD